MSDLISRKDAINAIIKQDGIVDKSVAKRILIQLPSAERTGKWIYVDTDNMKYDSYSCSYCHKEIMVDAERINDMFYCPNCGSKMEEEHE